MAFSNYFTPTDSKLFLAAIIAASLTTFAISAPLNPGVKVERCFAYSVFVFSGFSLIFFK